MEAPLKNYKDLFRVRKATRSNHKVYAYTTLLDQGDVYNHGNNSKFQVPSPIHSIDPLYKCHSHICDRKMPS